MGIGSALIYAPAFYASTDELVAISKAVAPYGGMYISHMPERGSALARAIDELNTISREAACRRRSTTSRRLVQPKLEQARAGHCQKSSRLAPAVCALRRTCTTTSPAPPDLDAAMPPWVQEGGYKAWAARLKDPAIRGVSPRRCAPDRQVGDFFAGVGHPTRSSFISFKATRSDTSPENAGRRGADAWEIA